MVGASYEKSMDELLHLIQRSNFQTVKTLAKEAGLTEEEVASQLKVWKENGTILGQPYVVNKDKLAVKKVNALIEVKIKPEAGGGYDRLANRIARFDQVISCSLFSGDYDLLLEVELDDNLGIATFVYDTLSKIGGVISTRTHFPLKTYKLNGICLTDDEDTERLPVTP